MPRALTGSASAEEELATGVPEPLSEFVVYLLTKAANRTRHLVQERLASFGLRPKHHAVLLVLDADGPLSQQALGARLGIDRTTVTAIVDQLERLTLAERTPDPNDRRAYRVRLTPRGERALERAAHGMKEAEAAALAPLSAADRAHLVALLRRVTGASPGREPSPGGTG